MLTLRAELLMDKGKYKEVIEDCEKVERHPNLFRIQAQSYKVKAMMYVAIANNDKQGLEKVKEFAEDVKKRAKDGEDYEGVLKCDPNPEAARSFAAPLQSCSAMMFM